MATQTQITRRTFMAACGAGAALLAVPAQAGARMQQWQGVMFGTLVRLQFMPTSPKQAAPLLAQCVAEAKRLENCFTLYDAQSELSQLNAHGTRASMSNDMQRILAEASHYERITHGAFSIREPAPSGRISLNAIAQGFITDRVAEMLRQEGVKHALIEMGETRAIGAHPTGRPWQVLLRGTEHVVALTNQSLAVSAIISPSTGARHIYPQGNNGAGAARIAVVADNATKADALATALITMKKTQAREIAVREGATLIYA